MNRPMINTDYGFETVLDPDGVKVIMSNLEVIESLITGHLETKEFNHTSAGIMTDSGEKLFKRLSELMNTYEYLDGQISSLLNKANKMKDNMVIVLEELKKNKVLTINGKSGNIRFIGAGEIVVGTAPANNTIIVNNTLSSEVLSE